ncbi:hypothetical protein ACH5RR_001047 [Cinchona calisaya]|uniref:Uncharacterized protein n=1 Tax=Cinchona calisaya TaxID=153742 RepID=A0ABD3B2U6_9GENT
MGISTFDGRSNLDEVKKWREHMQETLVILGVPEELKNSAVKSYLMGDAIIWWNTILPILACALITWETFNRAFWHHFYLSPLWRRKEKGKGANALRRDRVERVVYVPSQGLAYGLVVTPTYIVQLPPPLGTTKWISILAQIRSALCFDAKTSLKEGRV